MILHEPVELQKRALPFRKGFFIINDFVNRQKALKPFFITIIAKNTSSLFFAPVSTPRTWTKASPQSCYTGFETRYIDEEKID